MNRRLFLSRGAAGLGAAALAGCLEEPLKAAESKPPLFQDLYHEEEVDLPVRRRFDVVEEGVEHADGASVEDRESFASFLEEQGLAVESLTETTEADATLLELEYAEERYEDRGVAYAVGVVSGAYAALVDAGEPTDELTASIHDAAGEPFGEFTVRAAWAERYRKGELTAAEFGGKVGDTLESSA